MTRIAGLATSDRLTWLGLTVGVAGFCWGATRNPSALASLWTGDSWFWLAVLAGAAMLAAIIQGLARNAGALVLLLGCAVVVPAFGIGAFVAVLLILVTGLALGAWLLQGEPQGQLGIPSTPVFTYTVVGLSACSLLLGITAHWRINIPAAYLAFSAAALGLGWRHLAGAWDELALFLGGERNDAAPLFLRIVLWFAFGLHVSFAALAERFHDALAMHLVIARALAQFGYWHFDARDYAWAVQPMGGNWLFAWAYVLAGDAGEYAAKLLNATFLALICGLIVESRLVSKRLGLIAVAILVLMPLTFLESATLFIDNALTMFVVAAIIFAARIHELKSPPVIIGFAVASAGAMAVKLHGVVAFASVCLALLVCGGWRELYRSSRQTRLVCLVAFALALWPYAYAWYATGNPVLPHFNGIFKSAFMPPENFGITLYPGGVFLADFFDLTFSSRKYIEGGDGAGGFVLTLLLPAGLLLVATGRVRALRLVALASIAYVVLILINIRYIRYLFPVFPLLALVVVYPFAVVKGRYARLALFLVAATGTGWSLVRVPAAGWILNYVDLPIVFSASAKEALAELNVPPRKLGRIQAAYGDSNSRTVIFGYPMGADTVGRPIYTDWYNQKLFRMLLQIVPPEQAANTLAAMDTTHVIFDNRAVRQEWAPWHDAVEKYGHLITQTPDGELYEFHASEVPGIDLFAGESGSWRAWVISPAPTQPVEGPDLLLPPGGSANRPTSLADLAEGARVTLSVKTVCQGNSAIRPQINWLRADGSFIRVDAVRSECGDSERTASVSAVTPKDARAATFYFTNDGAATARLSGERAGAVAKP